MSGPWYECAGPTAEAVRKDVDKYISSYNIGRIKYQKEKDKIIQEALHEIIPNSRNDFGSWRGYATFGVMQQVAGEVMKDIRLKYSMFILRRNFTPYITHHLYKPGGMRFIHISNNSLVGKSVENPAD